MENKVSKWQKFKKFLKRNMTPTWAKHFSYQVAAFLVSVALVAGVATYAITKSYDERTLKFVDGFTVTAHTDSLGAEDNSLEFVQAALDNNVAVMEIDIRQRPDKTLVMNHDIAVTNSDGVPVADAFKLLQGGTCLINLDIKETRTLNALHDLLVEYNLLDRAFLTGISQPDIKAVKDSACCDMEYYLNYQPSRFKIFGEDYQKKLLQILDETGAVGINCNFTGASGTLSKLLHENGYKLSVWTVNQTIIMKRILVLKPDNITTKQYEKLNSVIENWGK